MKLAAPAVLLLASLLPPQEEKIRELIRKLDHDSYDVRDQAERDLVQAGEAAVPLLKKAIEEAARQNERSELKLRAEKALAQIEMMAEVRGIYREPRKVSVSARDTALGDVLEDLARQSGARIEASAVDRAAPVTLALSEAPLLEALDLVCRGHADRTFELREDGIRFVKEPHAACPSAFSGPFRVRVVKKRLEHATDFKASASTLQLTVAADYEPYLKPSRRCEIEITKAFDELRNPLEVRPGPMMADDVQQIVAGGRVVLRAGNVIRMAGGGGADLPHDFTLKGLADRAARVTIQGTARFSFPLSPGEIKFTKAAPGDTLEAGDYTITLDRVVVGTATISFRKGRGRPEEIPQDDVAQRLGSEGVVAVDEDGKEHKSDSFNPERNNRTVVFVGGVERQSVPVPYHAVFSSLQGRAIRELRFKFAHRAFVKSVPFEIAGIPLH